jgi:hypothetical protein
MFNKDLDMRQHSLKEPSPFEENSNKHLGASLINGGASSIA